MSISRANVTKIWTDLATAERGARGNGFVWCVDLVNSSGQELSLSRHVSREAAIAAISNLAAKSEGTIEIRDVLDHPSLALAPENLNCGDLILFPRSGH